MQKMYMKKAMERTFSLLLSLSLSVNILAAEGRGSIKGTVKDKASKEPLIGATIQISNTSTGATADFYGNFELLNIRSGVYNVEIKYVSYKTLKLQNIKVESNKPTSLNVELETESKQLEDITVVAQMKRNTDLAMLTSTRNSLLVQTGVSSQQISRTQDRNASEVIRRVPGISIIDEKFVIVRGLSQRYNNVWINNTAVPSSEADSRAFSFDIIPSSQLDNIVIVKSPAPELPADFTGGFIKIATKDIPDKTSFSVTYGTGINDQTHFRNFLYNSGSGTDFLGFDNGLRSLKSIVPQRIDNNDAQSVTNITKNGFNNNWEIAKKNALPDQKLNISYNYKKETDGGKQFAILSALNYSLTSKTLSNMENSRFGVYNVQQDKPVYLYKYNDNQYSTTAHLGGMLNLTYMPNKNDKYEFKNIVNQIGQDKYTDRSGYQYISGQYIQEKNEYYYSSRTTYSGQVSGTYNRTNSKLDWNAGYSYANKMQPDRRIINREENGFVEDKYYGEMQIDQNEIEREFSTLNEHIISAGSNYSRNFNWGSLKPNFKAGVYGEYRTRKYKTRSFFYRWNETNMPEEFSYGNVIDEILTPENFSADKLYIYEDTDNRNSYSGNNIRMAGYAAINIPIDKFNVYTGIRYENNRMDLKSYTRIKEYATKTNTYNDSYFFPSLNMTYKLTDKQLFRFAYGASVNRPEFREVSSSVYYDFDLFSNVMGNPELKTAYIQNMDLRYEYYPTNGELISISLFYKSFRNPIEWTYLDAGGSYTYTFENAKSADNFGLEVDIKKNLDFIGMPNFTWTFNGSIIDSKVNFEKGSLETDRPMQGQSPYLINTGLFYQNQSLGLSVGALYNRIGKRIVGVGRVDTTDGGSVNNDIPDAYEMPRNMLDLTISKNIGKRVEIKASARDILGEDAIFKQFPKYYDSNNVMQERQQITKKYSPGRNFSISANITF